MLKYLLGKRFAYFEQTRGLQNPETYGAVNKRSTHDALESVLTSLDYSNVNCTKRSMPQDVSIFLEPKLSDQFRNLRGCREASTHAELRYCKIWNVMLRQRVKYHQDPLTIRKKIHLEVYE